MDVFSSDDLTEPFFSKGERDVQQRHCLFPTFHELDDGGFAITVVTEYYGMDAS